MGYNDPFRGVWRAGVPSLPSPPYTAIDQVDLTMVEKKNGDILNFPARGGPPLG